jgi:hypothetical protein
VTRAGEKARPAKTAPARPRTYYKWKDAAGTVHVAQSPPSEEGLVYTIIRALQ